MPDRDAPVSSAQLLESLDRHFMAACPSLSTSQLREHETTGACRECRQRAQSALGSKENANG